MCPLSPGTRRCERGTPDLGVVLRRVRRPLQRVRQRVLLLRTRLALGRSQHHTGCHCHQAQRQAPHGGRPWELAHAKWRWAAGPTAPIKPTPPACAPHPVCLHGLGRRSGGRRDGSIRWHCRGGGVPRMASVRPREPVLPLPRRQRRSGTGERARARPPEPGSDQERPAGGTPSDACALAGPGRGGLVIKRVCASVAVRLGRLLAVPPVALPPPSAGLACKARPWLTATASGRVRIATSSCFRQLADSDVVVRQGPILAPRGRE